MICEACRDRRHGECRGGTWCDCQHKPPSTDPHHGHTAGAAPTASPTAGSGEDTEQPADDGSEPAVNWLRQG